LRIGAASAADYLGRYPVEERLIDCSLSRHPSKMNCSAGIKPSPLDEDVTRRRQLSRAGAEGIKRGKEKAGETPYRERALTSYTAAGHGDKPADNDTNREDAAEEMAGWGRDWGLLVKRHDQRAPSWKQYMGTLAIFIAVRFSHRTEGLHQTRLARAP
jgi:hypothetical protein